MSTKKILVIEDNQKHLEDAKAFFADEPEYQIEYMTTAIGFSTQMTNLRHKISDAEAGNLERPSPEYDGVITDIFMPWRDDKYTLEVPAGLGIAMLCKEFNIPVVLNTAGGGHGQKYYWIKEVVTHFLEKGMWLVANSPDGRDVEAETKDWSYALESLERITREMN